MNLQLPIDVQGLSKTYRIGFWLNHKVRALQQLDMRVESGQVYGLLGPNGAGKSTTIKILMNLVEASSGTARVFGLPPQSREARRLVGFLPENPSPYEYLTGEEFVRLSGHLAGTTRHELDARVKEVLGTVEMERAARLQIRRYSKGMVQRIGLAQAILHRPKLLILDEPTSGLDPIGRRSMRDLILAERARGTTILFCTHIISDVEALCDQVVVLVGGRRVRQGPVRELLTSEAQEYEVTLENLDLAAVQQVGIAFTSTHAMEGRVRVKVPEASTQELLRKALDLGGRVVAVQPARFSLEELFLKALAEAGKGTVGGEIS